MHLLYQANLIGNILYISRTAYGTKAAGSGKNFKCFDNSWEPKVSVTVSVSVTTTFVFMCRLKSDLMVNSTCRVPHDIH